jgi:hypothetical protein
MRSLPSRSPSREDQAGCEVPMGSIRANRWIVAAPGPGEHRGQAERRASGERVRRLRPGDGPPPLPPREGPTRAGGCCCGRAGPHPGTDGLPGLRLAIVDLVTGQITRTPRDQIT